MSAIQLSVDNAIASRNLSVVDSTGKEVSTAVVCIAKPNQVESNEWECAYRIIGLGDDSVYKVIGFDALHAIQCALTVVDGSLAGSELGENGFLRWNGEINLGFK